MTAHSHQHFKNQQLNTLKRLRPIPDACWFSGTCGTPRVMDWVKAVVFGPTCPHLMATFRLTW
jgi:hypothetical protein